MQKMHWLRFETSRSGNLENQATAHGGSPQYQNRNSGRGGSTSNQRKLKATAWMCKWFPICSTYAKLSFSELPQRGHSKRGQTQKHANERKRVQMSAEDRKRKSAKERKELCVQIANNQVWNNQVSEEKNLPETKQKNVLLNKFFSWTTFVWFLTHALMEAEVRANFSKRSCKRGVFGISGFWADLWATMVWELPSFGCFHPQGKAHSNWLVDLSPKQLYRHSLDQPYAWHGYKILSEKVNIPASR